MSVLEEKGNTNQALYESYFETINTSGNLKADTNPAMAGLYHRLTDVLSEVLTNPEADVTELMQKANDEYQEVIDR